MYSKILLDDPTLRPEPKFTAYAAALQDIIEHSEPQFSVGIFGGWGSGKTTLMRTIEDRLDKKVVSVWFNAWRYEKEEHLIIPLLDTLRDALVTWADDHADDPAVDPSFKTGAIKAARRAPRRPITRASRPCRIRWPRSPTKGNSGSSCSSTTSTAACRRTRSRFSSR